MKPDTKQDVCMTCHALVDWVYSIPMQTWTPLDHGTSKIHKCLTSPETKL
jgi:hypothetical protein